jgi:mRNA interferase HicA
MAGLRWMLVRQGGDHEVWDLDGIRVLVPRHREVNERTALRIRELLEDRLGDRWWQR